MGQPQVPIEVDDASGVWSVDGLPMILVPRHFFINNHVATEAALGGARYADLLFHAGHRSAYAWCEHEARAHGLKGGDVFHHYMRRLSQRGWGRFAVESVAPAAGRARISVVNSVFVLAQAVSGEPVPRSTCYMFRGWFAGALEFVCTQLGQRLALASEEIQCAAAGQHNRCVFETSPAPKR